jgi:preprotein translocase subunit SecD
MRSTTYLRLILAVLTVMVAGCNQLVGTAKTIRIGAPVPASAQDHKVIAERLREHTSGFSPTYSISDSAGTVVVQARGAPSDTQTKYLLSRRGLVQAKSEEGVLWFSQSDIVDAVAGFDAQQRTVLNLRLTESAAARVARVSAAAVGKVVVMELDGVPVSIARVSGPITGGMLQLTVNMSPEEASMSGTIIKSGPLSFSPGTVQIVAQ